MASNGTDKIDLGKPQFASHTWLEPIVLVGFSVVSIMLTSLYVNRYKHFKILDKNRPSRAEATCIWLVWTPKSSRFANHIHSRIVQKFPFLVEMFYWVLNYAFYSCTKAISHALSPAGTDVHRSIFSIFSLIEESDFQSYFLNGHPGWMTFNHIYSLVHIPGTVAFLSWWYWAAPDHERFAIARRTMTLGSFVTFVSFNFHDTVRQENAESVWVGGKMVNQLAAMPSLHFTYAFCIGATFIYHSNFWSLFNGGRRTLQSMATTAIFVILGIMYPLLVLSVIVATANNYWLDATIAMFSVVICFLINRVWLILLPLEDLRQAKIGDGFEESEHLLERYS
ncbi:hypothetical protein BDV09DRAFT_206092 [Aspergillus tetrazonus]